MKPLLLLLLVTALPAHSQSAPISKPTPAAFIPRGYRILPDGRATGDLNGDGRTDVALALGPVAEDTEHSDKLPPRLLLVLWRTAAGGYTLAGTARQALLGKDDGGIYGDPFAGLAIKGGVLSVLHYGGSSWRWSITGKFRWQQGGFYLVGTTNFSMHNTEEPCPNLAGEHRAEDNYEDVNLLTGQYERVKVSPECKFLENKRGRQPVKPLVPLSAYKPVP